MTVDTYNGEAALVAATRKHNIHLSLLVAETGLWAHPAVHQRLLAENGTGAVFSHCRRARREERRGTVVDGVRLDDNTYANTAIKRALGLPRAKIVGYHACHIWPLTCYDARYHTAVANLVLLPSPLAGLTDFDPEVAAALQYRAFELYGWHPEGQEVPRRPDPYPDNWQPPVAPSRGVVVR